jgi:uracil-DNA glycosylase family 4
MNSIYQKQISTACEGSTQATCLVLGDYPWVDELRQNRPIAGAKRQILDHWLQSKQISKHLIRIENLHPTLPKTNSIDTISTESLQEDIEEVFCRITQMPHLNLIVTFGNYSTFALTNKGKVRATLRKGSLFQEMSVSEAERKADISVLRGSIYQYTDLNGRKIKVIPALHPRDIIKFPKWGKRSSKDWEKIAKEMQNSNYYQVPRVHVIDPTEWEVKNFTNQLVENETTTKGLSVDIETWGKKLSCVGFAPNEYLSVTIPTTTREQLDTFLPYIHRLCALQTPKIFCNGLYDTYWLDYYKIPVNNYLWDIQYMHHALDPIESHSLNFLASIYSKENYWKDEAKDADEVLKYSKDLDALWTYNGKDCCVSYEVWANLLREMRKENTLHLYLSLYYPLLEPLLRMSRQGVRIDRKAQNRWRLTIEQQQREIRNKLEDIAGENLFATETKTELRSPTKEEWDELLPEATDAKDFDDRGIPKARIINREGRKRLLQKGLNYFMSGKKAGKIAYKVELDKKDFSKDKLFRLFHETLGLPKQYKRRKGKAEKTQSLDEGTIRKLIQKFPTKAGEAGNLLLTYRSITREHIYLRGGYDKDGRIRASFLPTTEAGRLKSSSNPRGTGFNLQNLKR